MDSQTGPGPNALVGPATGVPPVLRCEGLRKRFGERQAVDGVSLEIALGETCGLLGPQRRGQDHDHLDHLRHPRPRQRRRVRGGPAARRRRDEGEAPGRVVPQDLAIYPDLTARENLTFFGELYGMSGRALKNRVAEVLAIVALSDREHDWTAAYSGGMKRRLNIAIGLLHHPRLLILDEPTVGVDVRQPHARRSILLRLLSHGAFHSGEISHLLGTNGLPAIDLWAGRT